MRVCFFRRSGFLPGVARRAILFGAALMLLGAAARADIQNPGRSSFPGDRATERQGERPASGVPQTVAVAEGRSVTIILRARGHAGEMIDFLLRTPPAHGTLDGEVRQLTLNTAAVVYSHRPGDDANADSFSFAVQTRGSSVSAEAVVTVRIQEPPPSLVAVPAELDFGTVKAGGSTRAEVTLTNAGGGEASGRLDPPSPWEVDGPTAYRLSRGASQTFALVFRPEAERVYTEVLHFRDETGGGVRVVGTGLGGPPAQKFALPPGTNAELAAARSALAGANAQASAPEGDSTRSAVGPGAPTVPAASPTASVGVASLEPAGRGGMPSMPSAQGGVYGEEDPLGVASFTVVRQGRTTLDLSWRAVVPTPKSYRVEMQHLSLDPNDKLVVDWRPYALVEFKAEHGFVNAQVSGLPANTPQGLRIVAVDTTGRLATPSRLRVVYTLPPATWWRPTPLKVLFALLLVCGGLMLRQRLETRQILSELDASRVRRESKPAGTWG